jgi:hypothetical protein
MPNTGRRPLDKFVTVKQLIAAFLLSGAFASIGIFIATENGKGDDQRAAQSVVDAAQRVCLSGGEFRILTAQSNDLLRRSAIGLVPGQKPSFRTLRFIEATQPAIDDFLSQAAGTKYRVGGSGEVTSAVVADVRRHLEERCANAPIPQPSSS